MTPAASAHWSGNFKEGNGSLTTTSSILKETNFSCKTRFKDEVAGTNPDELLAAALAGCFTITVAAILTQKNITPTALDTEATLTMKGLSITKIHLSTTASVPGITADDFTAVTKDAEKNCLISKILNIPISSESHLKS